MKHLALAIAVLSGLAGPAHGASIFRCGDEYSATPCRDARTLVVAAVSAEQRAEAREVARREKALAAEMTRDRRAREALVKPALAGSLSGASVAAAAPAGPAKTQQKTKKNASPDERRDFVAAVPRAKKAGT